MLENPLSLIQHQSGKLRSTSGLHKTIRAVRSHFDEYPTSMMSLRQEGKSCPDARHECVELQLAFVPLGRGCCSLAPGLSRRTRVSITTRNYLRVVADAHCRPRTPRPASWCSSRSGQAGFGILELIADPTDRLDALAQNVPSGPYESPSSIAFTAIVLVCPVATGSDALLRERSAEY